MTTTISRVDPHNASDEEYQGILKKIEGENERCPLCTLQYHKRPILREENGWFLTENTWPYPNTKHHFLIISRAHRETLMGLAPEDMVTILCLARWVQKTYILEGGALAFRFGDTFLTGATIAHLHFQLIVPERNPVTGRAKTVFFPIG